MFSHFGEDSWTLDRDRLISFFRSNDQTSAQVGELQAATFQTVAMIVTRQSSPIKTITPEAQNRTLRPATRKRLSVPTHAAAPAVEAQQQVQPVAEVKTSNRDFALTVRIEINLPANGDKDTYDLIFKSIRDNLLTSD